MQAIKTILLLSFLFCFSALNAQQKQIDSLYNIFSKTKDLNIKSDVGFNIWKIHARENDSLNEAKIIDKVQNTFVLNARYDLLADWYDLVGRNTGGIHGENEYSITNILKSLKYLNKGIEFSEKLENSENKWGIQGDIYRNIGFKYRDIENYSKSIDNQFLALRCYEKANDLDMVLETYSTLAAIYGRANDNINSLKYARKSITYSSNNGFIPWEYAKKLNVLGTSFLRAEKLDSALFYFMKSSKVYIEDKNNSRNSYNFSQIGIVYTILNQFDSANVYLLKGLELSKNNKDQLSIGYTYRDLGGLEFKKGNYEKAIEYLKTSLEIFRSKKKLGGYSIILKKISESYEAIGNTNEALRYYKQAKSLDDSLINTSTIREVAIKEATFNYTKDQELSALKLKDKAVAIELLNNKNELQELVLRKNELESIEKNKSIQLLSQQDSLKSFTIRQSKAKEVIALVESRRQKNIIWSIIMGLILLTIFSIFMVQRFKISQKQKKIIEKQKIEVEKQKETVEEQKVQVEKEKQRSEELLLNILPKEVVEELKTKGESEAKLIDEVTVLFTDFKGFTALSERLAPKELIRDLHECFSAFDKIIQKHGLEKIKTIGDAYMAAGGLPIPNTTHAIDVVRAAKEIKELIDQTKIQKIANNQPFFEIRIGVNTGPVVAGIVGVKKFQYDIWGDTVNTASRMESLGEIGEVNISETTYDLIKDQFKCEYRGEVEAKGKGKLKMYFVN